ncbi:hypothetical protein TRFO_22876 [Tritrichomonas foetus]|uniref:Uncharacterized protein n=1 Tax=Tritrichomonas foetus TaxID=1144522 RepID=A0A1J4KFI6_9EUKA|nr:hypothetical protein TRFO_22876 [Tritrichomonas foetus]|eukprot:OHT08540.1 hypothetical protein TRFO_22876 [Tritrichomonas foetus]
MKKVYAFPTENTNTTTYTQYMDQAISFPSFPDPSFYNSYSEFRDASLKWYDYINNSIDFSILPYPVSAFYHRPSKYYCYQGKTRSQKKLIENKSSLESIILKGNDNSNCNELLNDEIKKNSLENGFKSNVWSQYFISIDPNPHFYDSYIDFVKSSDEWATINSIPNLPFHPKSFCEKIETVPILQKDKCITLVPISDRKRNKKFLFVEQLPLFKIGELSKIMRPNHISEFLRYNIMYYYYPKKINFGDIFNIMQRNGITPVLKCQLSYIVKEMEGFGTLPIIPNQLQHPFIFSPVAKAFLENRDNKYIFNSVELRNNITQFLFYVNQIESSKSYYYRYKFMEITKEIIPFNPNGISNYFIENITLFLDFAFMFNDFDYSSMPLFDKLLKEIVNMGKDKIGETNWKLLTVLIHSHLSRIFSLHIKCFNERSNFYNAIKKQTSVFLNTFGQIVVPALESSLTTNNAVVSVLCILLVIDSNDSALTTFFNHFHPSLFHFFNQISDVSSKYFTILLERVIFQKNYINCLFIYFQLFLAEISIDDFDNLNPLMISFLSLFINTNNDAIFVGYEWLIKGIKMLLFSKKIIAFEFINSIVNYSISIRFLSKKDHSKLLEEMTLVFIDIYFMLGEYQQIYILRSLEMLLVLPSAKKILSETSDWIHLVFQSMKSINDDIVLISWKLFRKIFMSHSNIIVKYFRIPKIKSIIIQGIQDIPIYAITELLMLIGEYSFLHIEVDSPEQIGQRNKGGFIFLLSGLPNELIELVQLFNDSGINVLDKYQIVASSARDNPVQKNLWIWFRKVINERNSCKHLLLGHTKKSNHYSIKI